MITVKNKQILGGLGIYFALRLFSYFFSPTTPLFSANPINWILSGAILLASIYFLLNLPDEIVSPYLKKFAVTDRQIREKAESLYNYCRAHGRKYKDYNAMLRNALQKDFGTRTPLTAFNSTADLPELMDIAGLERLRRMKNQLLGARFTN